MEKKEFKKKLKLDKQTISKLTVNELTTLKGGATVTARKTECNGQTCACTLASC